MSYGISFSINDDGSIEMLENKKIIREKGNSLIQIPDDFIVIDIETTGYDARWDEIIEIGALKVRNGEVVDKFQSLIKPDSPIDDFIIELTGITNEMLEDAPTIDIVIPQFKGFIGDDILVGHNINFDINFLYDNMMEYINDKLPNDFVDLMRLSRKVYPYFENHKLITVAKNLGVEDKHHHRAINDCQVTYNCLMKLSEHLNNNSIVLKDLFKKNRTNQKSYIDLRTIFAETDEFDEEHIFYDKYCTFTGKLEKLDRKDASQLAANVGGKLLNSVTRQTNFLILGNFDYCSSIKDGKSSKLKKAEQLILKGQDLKIISEDVFYDLIFN